MPIGHICWTGNTFREFIWRIKLFVLYIFGYLFSTVDIVMKLKEAELGGPDGGADKFVDITLVFGVEE